VDSGFKDAEYVRGNIRRGKGGRRRVDQQGDQITINKERGKYEEKVSHKRTGIKRQKGWKSGRGQEGEMWIVKKQRTGREEKK